MSRGLPVPLVMSDGASSYWVHALAGCLPAYATINAATYEQIDDLFRAVHSAFGPPESSQTNFTSTARLRSTQQAIGYVQATVVERVATIA